MTGVTAIVAAGVAGAPTLYNINVDSGSSEGNQSAGASNGFGTTNFGVSTNGPDPTTSFTYSTSKVSGGSSKLSIGKVHEASADVTPTYRINYTGLAVGESVSATFRITASKAGYNNGVGVYHVEVTRAL